MKTFHFIQAMLSYNLIDPHSKALEPDCLSPRLSDYDTVPLKGEGSPCGGTSVMVHLIGPEEHTPQGEGGG